MSVSSINFKRRRGPLFWVGIVLLLLIVAVIGGQIAIKSWLVGGQPARTGELAISGLDGPVDLRRDADGLLSIRAGSTLDAYRALGFAHAQDRLFQMEMMRRFGSGRISELLGGIGGITRIDRFVRTLGLRNKAEADWANATPALREMVTAYAAGVNAYLTERTGPLPIEFQLLGLQPEPWLPVDSMVWGQLMALQLSGNWTHEATRARLLQALDADAVQRLYPGPPAGTPVTLPPSLREAAREAARANAIPPREAAAAIESLSATIAALPDLMKPPGASNAWVIAGEHTTSGSPILANDPHLGFMAPIQWYLVRIEAPGLLLAGATAPGVPLMIFGHNGRAAWGFTTTHSDTMDFVIEKTDPTDPGAYLTPAGPRLYGVRREVIGVRWGDDEVLEVRSTRHGPIVTGLHESAGEVLAPYAAGAGDADLEIALAWPALSQPNGMADALYAASRATTWTDFRNAMRRAGSPQQNIFYADVDGRIAFIAPALVPVRNGYDGAWPVTGWNREQLWSGFAPFDALPQALNPAEGVIFNGNNRVVGPDSAVFLGADAVAHHRAARIEEMLAASMPDHSADDSARIQLDTLSLAARELTPLMITAARAGAPEDARAAEALDRLDNWPGDMIAADPEPAIYAAWLGHLHRRILSDDLGDLIESYDDPDPYVIANALNGVDPWCDDVTTDTVESCAEQAAAALDLALTELDVRFGEESIADWRWGELHFAKFRHGVFDRIPGPGGFLGGPQVETGGGDHTVNRGGYANDFRHVHGAGLRAIYDLGDLNAARFMIGTGQSGDPLSPHFDDMAERWRDGRWVDLAPSRFVSAPVFTLTPKP